MLGLDGISYDPTDAGVADGGGPPASDDAAPPVSDGGEVALDASHDGPFSLAVGLGAPQALAVDSTSLYWINATGSGVGSVQSMLKNGKGTVVTYATNQPSPLDVSVAEGNVYWSVNQTVATQAQCLAMTASKDGGPASCVARGPFASVRMTTRGTYIVILARGTTDEFIGFALPDGGYQNVQTMGASQSVTATSSDIFLGNGTHVDEATLPALGFLAPSCVTNCGASPSLDITVDLTGVRLLWITQAGVFTAPTATTNATATELAKLPSAGQRIARDASYIYVTTEESVIAVPLAVSLGGAMDGATYLTLASGEATPFGLAVDSEYVYWTDGNGAIRATPVPAPP